MGCLAKKVEKDTPGRLRKGYRKKVLSGDPTSNNNHYYLLINFWIVIVKNVTFEKKIRKIVK